ncbi:nitrilase-related carbon-nitrogen hydrolase [uncultured Jannaschia sp.]|uniref:nitrilase-related carbon-nitrogen hydrolase n=1 Tax=uncultured Jannaschia sp. TaxID=293347 RepID=UPI0026098F71|nr:nitrilase-related carbon-nitrogen hydrolase [uncultured Jannaschia sp.]
MSDTFRLTMAQLDATPGDLHGNAAKARAAWAAAREAGADMVILPEMFLAGGPPRGLARRPAFVAHARRVLDELIAACADGPAIGIGVPSWPDGAELPFNAWVVAERGRIVAEIRKHHRTREGGLDETRDFGAGDVSGPYRVGPVRLGTPISEDARFEDVAETLAETGAEILVVPNAAPYARGGQDARWSHAVARVVETGLPLVWLNLVGGADDLVFDGASFALNPGGRLADHLPSFAEAIVHVDFDRTDEGWRARDGARVPQPEGPEADYRAMVAGLRARMAGAGTATALLELSGDPASALVAAVAADALGPANLRCVTLLREGDPAAPLETARTVVERLGCRFETCSTDACDVAAADIVARLLGERPSGAARANVRSRCGELLLTSLAEASGALLLRSACKSDLATGGDGIGGGYDPVADLYGSELPALCRWRNAHHVEGFLGPAGEVVPACLLDAATAAGTDALPSNSVLDDILERLRERGQSPGEIVRAGHDRATVRRVAERVRSASGRPRPTGPGIAGRTAGLDRLDPVAHRWRDPSGED